KNAATATDNGRNEALARAAAVADLTLSQSRQLAAVAITHLADHLDLSLLLSVEANRAANTVEARDSLLRSLEYNPRLAGFVHGKGVAGEGVDNSPDGRTRAGGGCGYTDDQGKCRQGEIRLWDPAARLPIDPPLIGHTDQVDSVAFSPDGRIVASGSADGT